MRRSRSHARAVRLLAAGLGLGVAGGLLLGCTGESGADGPPAPDDAAAALASGLARGELSGVTPASAQAGYDAVVERLGDAEPRVDVVDVQTSGDDRATAVLGWTWPFGPDGWSYETEAPLRLVDEEWETAWSPALVEPSLTDGELLATTTVDPPRGQILGARGLALVTDRPVLRLGVDRGAVSAPAAVGAARTLAGLVGIEVAPYVKQVRAAGPKAFVEAITYRRDDVPAAVARRYPTVPGVLAIPDERPLAPTREFAAPILGTVGPVTAEMVAEDPAAHQPGDQAGLSGLQARYDEQLRGTPGVVVNAISDDPAGGDDERELFRSEPVPGEDLRLTLDADLQVEAESLLADIGPASALVALQPSTGNLLAAANGPGAGGYNIATFGQFAPGSTFKAVSSLALLRAGLTPDSTVPCTATLTVDGKRFKNYSDYPAGALGRVPLRTAVANSCNTAFISQRDQLGETDLADAAASLGLGRDHDLGFPAYFGSVEPPASQTEAAANLIGQGRILASPMAMAAVVGTVQHGAPVVPRMIEGVEVAPPGDVEPLTAAQTRALQGMLRAVVTEGSGRALADLPGPPVIAKTGTAEYGTGARLGTHAWMVAAQGDLAVAVFVEEGQSGSTTAGPVLEAFLRAAG
ncbi:penicillin-binding transpeptidase domain-containing protein [Nocardioides pantholopis]|uniref:penicillin-binding transpeptidase domain-containing protein n=1 Tax=Nocardioides pantholopis TaxID=2483798 RepID=UPI000F08A09B|nr:penicillin-binding transpeptidase domain-containing protein [Nocardioides pantholopis]